MEAKNDVVLREKKDHADKALGLMDTPEAKAISTEMNDKVVALNEAETAAEKAAGVEKAQVEVEAAEKELTEVVAVIPAMVRNFDHDHYARLPKEESFVGTNFDYHWQHLLPALRQGGRISLVMADALEFGLTRRDKARHHLLAAGTHDARAKDRVVLARKELGAAVHKAEVFVIANTEPGAPARLALKRPRKRDARTPEQKAADDRARAAKLLARADKRDPKKPAPEHVSSPPALVAVPAPTPESIAG